MRLAFLDFEATGLDPQKARVIEYAAVLWDTELKQPLEIRTSLIETGATITQEISEITGITQAMTAEFGDAIETMLENLTFISLEADFIVAHNALDYDKPLLAAEISRASFGKVDKPWIDTLFDLPYPAHIKDRKLTHLALAHEFINPMPHRALADVFTMQKIFCKYDLHEILKINATPMVTVRADVTFNNKDLAKKRGYHWDSDHKIWKKRMREFHLATEMRDAEFGVIVLIVLA